MKNNNDNLFTETQKIRHYVMNLIYRNGNKSVRIPSSRELAEEFQLTRFTIRVALEQMTKEKYLIAKQGIGTFTNPLAGFRFMQITPPPLIGLKFGPGDQFYYDAPMMRGIADVMQALAAKNFNSHMLTGGGVAPEEIKYELDHSYVDAVLGINCSDAVLAEAAKRMPAVGIDCRSDEATCIEYRFETAVDQLIRCLSCPVVYWDIAVQHSVKFKNALQNSDMVELVEYDLAAIGGETKLPGAIITHAAVHEQLYLLLKSRKSPPGACKLVFMTQSATRLPYWLVESPRAAASVLAAAELERLLNGDREVRHHRLDYELRPLNQDVED